VNVSGCTATGVSGFWVKSGGSEFKLYTNSGCSGSSTQFDDRHAAWVGGKMFFYVSSSRIGILSL
jgi:hypothetical protein